MYFHQWSLYPMIRFRILPARRTPILLVALIALVVAGCGGSRTSTGLVKRINPPTAGIQRLLTAADGSLQIELRLQNFSTFTMRYGRIVAGVQIAGSAAGRIDAEAGIEIPGLSSDVIETRIHLPAGDRPAVERILATGAAIEYTLTGSIQTTEPDKRFEFQFESRLNPVPGRPGEFR